MHILTDISRATNRKIEIKTKEKTSAEQKKATPCLHRTRQLSCHGLSTPDATKRPLNKSFDICVNTSKHRTRAAVYCRGFVVSLRGIQCRQHH